MARSRSRVAPLLELLGGIAQPVYVLDERRRVIYCNAACERWTGQSAADLKDVRCDYHSEGAGLEVPQSVAASLCPPADVFAGQRTRGLLALPSLSGTRATRQAEFWPLLGDDQQPAGVLVMVEAEELTEPAAAEAERDGADKALHARLQRLRQEIGACYRPDQLIGSSPATRRVRDQVRCAMAGAPRVVIVGPPGSGREHVARTIFYGHDAAGAPAFITQACPVIDPEMLQTTLKAFLRQHHETAGPRAPALLLLDVDGLSMDAQMELAGFLQLPQLDLRTLATARRDLLVLAAEGKFRGDLAHLLTTLTIELRPLSERAADLPLLAQHFLEQANAAGGKQLSGFTSEALDLLTAYSWPRNVDELAGVVEQACRQAEGAWVNASDLPMHLHLAATARPARGDERIQLDEFLVEIERELIRRSLKRAKGNKAKAARLLGIHRARLVRRVSQLGLETEQKLPFRPLDAPSSETRPDCQS